MKILEMKSNLPIVMCSKCISRLFMECHSRAYQFLSSFCSVRVNHTQQAALIHKYKPLKQFSKRIIFFSLHARLLFVAFEFGQGFFFNFSVLFFLSENCKHTHLIHLWSSNP